MTPLFHIWAPASLDTLREPSQTLSNAKQISKVTIKYALSFFPCTLDANLMELVNFQGGETARNPPGVSVKYEALKVSRSL